jgi:hypothetical protein
MQEERSQVLWRALERVIPDIRDRAELVLTGTPLTHERFLNRHRGTYGAAISAANGSFPGPQTPVPGLYRCPLLLAGYNCKTLPQSECCCKAAVFQELLIGCSRCIALFITSSFCSFWRSTVLRRAGTEHRLSILSQELCSIRPYSCGSAQVWRLLRTRHRCASCSCQRNDHSQHPRARPEAPPAAGLLRAEELVTS